MKEIARFEKKGHQFKVMLGEEDIYLIAENGMKGYVLTMLCDRHHGWYYEVDSKFIRDVMGIEVKQPNVRLVDPSAEQAKEMLNEAKKEAKKRMKRRIEDAFALLSDDENLTLIDGTDITFVRLKKGDLLVGDAKYFKTGVSVIKKSGIDIGEALGRKADKVDVGDYSITHEFHMTLGEFKKIVEVAKGRLAEIEAERERRRVKKEKERKAKFEEAKRTEKKVHLREWSEPCNDPTLECDVDILIEYAMPDGSTQIKRSHTY